MTIAAYRPRELPRLAGADLLRYSIFRCSPKLQRPYGWPPMWREPEHPRRNMTWYRGGGGHGLATPAISSRNGINKSPWSRKPTSARAMSGDTTYQRSKRRPRQRAVLRMVDEIVGKASSRTSITMPWSPGGVINLYHADSQRDAYGAAAPSCGFNGVDAELLDRIAVRELVAMLAFDNARFPTR